METNLALTIIGTVLSLVGILFFLIPVMNVMLKFWYISTFCHPTKL